MWSWWETLPGETGAMLLSKSLSTVQKTWVPCPVCIRCLTAVAPLLEVPLTTLNYTIIDYIIIQYADASTPKAIIGLEVHGSLSARFHQTQFLTIVKHSCCMSPLLCHVWWPSSLRGSMQTRWRPSSIWRISRETPWLAERNGRTSWQVTWNQRMIQIAPLELKLCENRVLFNVVHWFLWNHLRFQFLKWTIWSMSTYRIVYIYI